MLEAIERFGSTVALVSDTGEELSFRELAERADVLAQQIGGARQLVAIECENTFETICAYVGLVRARHPVILTAPGGAAEGKDIAARFRPNFVFGRDAGGLAGFRPFDAEPADMDPELSVLLSTSGSTGSAKLVRLSRANVDANARSIAEYLDIEPTDRAITSLPMHYSYGLSVVNSHLSAGASLLVTDLSISQPEFFEAFDRYGATNFQGVPHSFEILARTAFLQDQHPGLRFFTLAGGRLSEERVGQFARFARDRGVKFFAMYGQTEATARMAYVPPDDLLENPGVIGKAIPDGQLTVERDGLEVPDGTEGEIVYRGPNVMMGYAETRAELALGRVTTELKTGDLARRLPSGYLQITGRASRFIKPFGLRIGLDDVEDRLRRLGLIAAATGTDERMIIALAEGGDPSLVRDLVTKRFKLPAAALSLIEVAQIPRNQNGKIDYPAIRAMSKPETMASRGMLRERAAEALGLATVDPSKSFVELGGDSLSYVRFTLAVEEVLGYVPSNWEQTSIAELEGLDAPRSVARPVSAVRRMSTDTILRALAIVGVVINHIFDLNLDGSSLVLVTLAGFSFARFQIPQVLGGGFWGVIRSLGSRVLIPYYLNLLLLVILTKDYWSPSIFLVYTFVPTDVQDIYSSSFLFLWFIEVYFYLILIGSSVLLLPSVRRLAKNRPALLPLVLYVALEALRIFGSFVGDEGFFHSMGLAMTANYFVLGWLLFVSRNQALKLVVVAGAIASIILFPTPWFEGAWRFLLPATLALILLPSLPTGRWLGTALSLIAASSLYIYLEQIFVLAVSDRLLQVTPSFGVGMAMLAVCLVLGVAVQLAVNGGVTLHQRRREAAGSQPALLG